MDLPVQVRPMIERGHKPAIEDWAVSCLTPQGCPTQGRLVMEVKAQLSTHGSLVPGLSRRGQLWKIGVQIP